MLTQRLTKKIKVVSIYDEALLGIDDKTMTLYAQTRDFSLIEKELPKLEDKVTVFHCLPLRADKEYLMDGVLESESHASWQIFKHHVQKAENFNTDDGTPIIMLNDDSVIDKKCRENIPRDIVQEIAGVIIRKGNESTKPFMMPDTWLRTRILSRHLLVNRAQKKSATENNTE
jgi:hypothetical protein